MRADKIYKLTPQKAQKLYQSGGADYAFATSECMQCVAKSGALLAMDTQDGKVMAGGFVPMSARCALTLALYKTGVFCARDIVLLPIVCGEGADISPLLYSCLARAGRDNIKALLAIKQADCAKLRAYFEAKLVLRAMRPLHALRAYYIFEQAGNILYAADTLELSKADTYTVSRYISEDYVAIGLIEDRFILKKKIEVK